MNKQYLSINEYVVTIILSLIISVAIGLVVELDLLFRSEDYVNSNELKVENLSEFFTIEQLEKKLIENPEDVIINLRLAKMYEGLNLLEKANEYYKNALKYSARSNYTLYSYAIFCAKNNLFAHSATLAEELSGNSKKTNFYKAKIYEEIAKGLSKQKNYLASTKSYQIVYKYAKGLNDFKYANEIRDIFSKEYIKLADYYMEQNEPAEAIASLKNSLKLRKSAQANYKLGLIYAQNNPKEAEKYISEAFYKDPYLVNPYVFNSVLQKLMDSARLNNKNGEFNYYDSKMTRFKNKVSQVYLYKDELIADNSKIVSKKNIFGKVSNILTFELKNNTPNAIDNLYIKAELFVNGKKYEIEKRVVAQTRPLDGFDELNNIQLILDDEIKFNDIKENNDIFVRYFAKKREEAPWVLIKIDFINT